MNNHHCIQRKSKNISASMSVLMFTISVILLITILSGCSISKCNTQILERVKNTYIRQEFNETLGSVSEEVVNGVSYLDNKIVNSIKWKISGRGDNGCIVEVVSEINGKSVSSPVFYVDLDSQTISPEDEWASLVFIKAEYSLDENRLLPLGP